MKKTAIRVAAAAAMMAIPMAVAGGVSPALGNAQYDVPLQIPDCGPGKWFDPNMSICRSLSDITNPQDCGPGNYWDPFGPMCRPIFG